MNGKYHPKWMTIFIEYIFWILGNLCRELSYLVLIFLIFSSRTGILDRLQAVQDPNRGGASNEPSSSNPGARSADSFLTVNESRRLQGQRRFRRPRRLRRVYEVLTESTSNSDHSDGDDQDQNQESDVENHSGEARPRTSEVNCLKTNLEEIQNVTAID